MHPAIEMDTDEREELLRQPLTIRFATCPPDGFPHVVPVWYVADEDGPVYFDSDRNTAKVRNVEREGAAAGVVDTGDEYAELRGVLLQGTAEVLTDDDVKEFVVDRYAEKYWGGSVPSHVRDRNTRREKVVVQLNPLNVVTWDFSKVSDNW